MDRQFFYLRPYCTCKDDRGAQTLLGVHQKEFEILSLDYDFSEVMRIMKITRMCCRLAFLHQPKLLLDSSSESRFSNKTGKTLITEDTQEIVPKN